MTKPILLALPIIAHTDLPGGYRLLRIVSEELAAIIAAGDDLLVFSDKGKHILAYLRHSGSKVDLLFLLDDNNQPWITGQTLPHCQLLSASFPIFSATLNVYTASPARLGNGLSLVLAPSLAAQNTLFLFELLSAAPFRLQPSRIYIPYLPATMTATMNLIEEANSAARFVSRNDLPGCYAGTCEEVIGYIQQNYGASLYRLTI